MQEDRSPGRGRIVAVSISRHKGEKKSNLPAGKLRKERGLEGDAHAGPWHRQVSLLAIESIDTIRGRGLAVAPGDFAENITTSGIRLWEQPVGSRLAIGKRVLLEVTQIGKKCHSGCAIFQQVGDCVMPREGIFARVLKGGTIKPGDSVRVLPQPLKQRSTALRKDEQGRGAVAVPSSLAGRRG